MILQKSFSYADLLLKKMSSYYQWFFDALKGKHLFETNIICNIRIVFNVTFDKCNVF